MQWFILLLIGIGTIRGCGMATHIFISHRAMQLTKDQNLYKLLSSKIEYLQAGSYFPDWGYACLNHPEASEVAHWPQFWDQVLKMKPSQELMAFLFGMVSHGVADASWHSLNTEQGFIEYLQYLDFNGDLQTAHDTADYGGEMVLAHSSKLGFLSRVWKWPVKELVQIYKALGLNSI
jgi:glycosylphosphatidylinositol phospholipase D